jgi:hypothetical protein
MSFHLSNQLEIHVIAYDGVLGYGTGVRPGLYTMVLSFWEFSSV